MIRKTLAISMLFAACTASEFQAPMEEATGAGSSGGGPPSLLTALTEVASLDDCPDGGFVFDHGFDVNGDGTLNTDEVRGSNVVCHGAPGEPGTDGALGEAGARGDAGFSVLVVVTAVAPNADLEDGAQGCPAGGQRADVGLDDGLDSAGQAAGEARDGILDPGEIETTVHLCHGPAGAAGQDGEPGGAGQNSLVRIEGEEPGANCPAGGVRIRVGLDDDGDGQLADEEVDDTTYVCSRDVGPDGDVDADGVANRDDNCAFTPNADQRDIDSDAHGDACDPDIDGDGFANADDCGPEDPSVHPGAVELCNGVDDDCVGGVDDAYPDLGEACDVGVGECHAAGERVCSAGMPDMTECGAVAGEPSDEVLDDLDNNCDGFVDEGLCGNGVREGEEACDDGNGVDDDMCSNACVRGCHAAQLSGGGPKLRVDWAGAVPDSVPNLTVEVWLNWDGQASPGGGSPYLIHSSVNGGLGPKWMGSGGGAEPNTWTHVANVLDASSSSWRSYVNGVQAWEDPAEYPGGCCGFTHLDLGAGGRFIGGSGGGDRGWSGLLTGLRITAAALYDADFDPPQLYGPTEDTLVFLPLTGEVVPDQDAGPRGLPVETLLGGTVEMVPAESPYCESP